MPWSQFFQVFFTTGLLPKVGVGIAIGYHFSFLETLLASGSSCILTSFLFTFLFDGAINWAEKFLDRKFPNRKRNKKIFTRKNRLIIKSKKNFGVIGISFISPLFLSIPLGSFLCIRFFGQKVKTFIWLSVFSIFWVVIFYFFMDAIVSIFN